MKDEKAKTPQTQQVRRITDAEMQTIKTHFADNDPLLIALRKVFLQLDLTVLEKDILSKTVKGNRPLLHVISKSFLPTIDGDAPLGQQIDLWMTIDLKDKDPDVAYCAIAARQIVINYLGQRIADLDGEQATGMKKIFLSELLLVDKENPVDVYVRVSARNTIVGHVEMQLQTLRMLAGLKNETVEQTQNRLAKDSNK